MITSGTTAELFLGAAYRAGDQPDPGAGTVEGESHNSVHAWTGDPTQLNGENMGATHQDFTDPDWLNSTFLFYDENAQLVRVRVQDCLDTDALRYTYQGVDIPWINVTATPAKRPPGLLPPVKIPPITFPVKLDIPTSVIVVRPEIGISSATKEEVLVVEGVQMGKDQLVKFDVFIDASNFFQGLGASASQFAGSFIELPHQSKNGRSTGMNTTVRLGITELLREIGAAFDKTLIVTLVPRNGTVQIGGLKIEFSLPSII
uniref:Polyphenol oxidase C-terminal domain-containing protein n=1 Tax=Ananas comosus var. bracteatus TaxID=296719 RepID=A0A6V7QVI1_ANACO